MNGPQKATLSRWPKNHAVLGFAGTASERCAFANFRAADGRMGQSMRESAAAGPTSVSACRSASAYAWSTIICVD